MSESFIRMRSGIGIGAPRLGDQARQRIASNTRKSQEWKIVEGQFDRFYPGDIPIWLNISTAVAYAQQIYDRSTKSVVDTETTWFEFLKHYIPRNKTRFVKGKKVESDFICSCGPHADQPCWGHTIRTSFFEKMDAIKDRTGVKPADKAPVGAATQFALGITVMEAVYAVPLRDSQGKVRTNKAGKIIYRYTPAPVLESSDEKISSEYSIEWGYRMHWTVGTEQLEQLMGFDDDLRNYCGDCSGEHSAKEFVCPCCGTSVMLPRSVTGIDLRQERNKTRTCKGCGEKTAFSPKVVCTDCGGTTEGRLTSFDLRIMAKKTGNKYILELVSIRIPGWADNPAATAHAKELIAHPLDLSMIFAPTPLERQKFLVGDELSKGLDPRPRKAAEAETESYADSDDADTADIA